MDNKLLQQLRAFNPWWLSGPKGIEDYGDPEYHRELFDSVLSSFKKSDQIISVVGMRQVGKSTLMRQIIKQFLNEKIDPRYIFYVSLDDHYLKTHYSSNEIFDLLVETYQEAILKTNLKGAPQECLFFLDEINQLANWEKILKSYYDKHFPVKYFITGSSAVLMKRSHRESLLGRAIEYTLPPFSFKEYLEYQTITAPEKDIKLLDVISGLRRERREVIKHFNLELFYKNIQELFKEANIWLKPTIHKHLQKYIIDSGFPRAWQRGGDFLYRQKFLWEQHVGKVLFTGLLQAVAIRRPKDLETLFARIIDLVGKEMSITNLRQELGMNPITLDRYINYLRDLSLVFRLQKTKSKKVAPKRRSTYIKFYLTDVALRNAFYKKTEDVFFDPEEMSIIAENLVCIVLKNFLLEVPNIEEQLSFYRERQAEIDFILKLGDKILPIEVKWREGVPTLKAMDKLQQKWSLPESMLITKDFPLTYKKGRLSIPLWFFLLTF